MISVTGVLPISGNKHVSNIHRDLRKVTSVPSSVFAAFFTSPGSTPFASSPGIVSPVAGIGETGIGIGAQRQPFFLPIESVLQPPQLAAGRQDFQVQAASVEHTLRLVGRLDLRIAVSASMGAS